MRIDRIAGIRTLFAPDVKFVPDSKEVRAAITIECDLGPARCYFSALSRGDALTTADELRDIAEMFAAAAVELDAMKKSGAG